MSVIAQQVSKKRRSESPHVAVATGSGNGGRSVSGTRARSQSRSASVSRARSQSRRASVSRGSRRTNMNASAGLYRQPSGRLELELIESLVGTKPMRVFARAIIGGEVDLVRAIITSQKKLPKSWYDSAFDNEGRKLVAFTVHVALENGMTKAYEDILLMVIKHSHNKSDITTCLYKKRHECVAHVVARHAKETHHVNRVGNMVSDHLKNRGAAWHGMLSKPGPNGRLPGNHAKFPAIGQHMGVTKKHVSRNNSRSGRTRTTNTLTNRELQSRVNNLSYNQMLRALDLIERNQARH